MLVAFMVYLHIPIHCSVHSHVILMKWTMFLSFQISYSVYSVVNSSSLRMEDSWSGLQRKDRTGVNHQVTWGFQHGSCSASNISRTTFRNRPLIPSEREWRPSWPSTNHTLLLQKQSASTWPMLRMKALFPTNQMECKTPDALNPDA